MNQNQTERFVVVDLDGTLIKSDVLLESLFLLARRHPETLVKLPFWLLQGRAVLKHKIAEWVRPDVSILPYRKEVLDLLRSAKEDGKKIVLASASDDLVVSEVAAHLGIFDRVIASDGTRNLKGKTKLEEILKITKGESFGYFGDSKSDLAIWEASNTAYVVTSGPKKILQHLSKAGIPVVSVPAGTNPSLLFNAIRPHQWVKNVLVFLPLIMSHQFGNPKNYFLLLYAFCAMCLCASSVYLLNDLFDMEPDRRHHIKKNRVFAAGSVPVPLGLIASLLLAVAGVCLSLLVLPSTFTVVLLVYLGATFCYSMVLKGKLFADIIGLALLYTLRILAGGEAVHVEVSAWLLTFSSFFFLSLAFVKRYVELQTHLNVPGTRLDGRNYGVGDIPIVLASGISSSYLSVLVFFLYIANSKEVMQLYARPKLLWLLGPVFVYWFGRIWFMAQRGKIDSDPVMFALRDMPSRVIAGVCIAIVFVSAFLK
jgi:4-hydroxybenzoate polyprenyltransferase/phosphoserine phosphatase